MSSSFPVLTFLVMLPVAGAVALLLLPKSWGGLFGSLFEDNPFKPVAAVVSAVVAVLAGWMFANFSTDSDVVPDVFQFQFVERYEWIERFGISWHLGVDGLSLFLVVLTALIFPILIIGLKAEHTPRAYYVWLLLLEVGCLGVFLALDLFLFFVFFEVVLVPIYFLIGGWGHGRRTYAATKFFLFTMLGSAFMLVGIVALTFLQASATGEAVTFDLLAFVEGPSVSTVAARWLFLAFAVAFAVKVPIFPLHTWLPDAHANAPTAGSVILAAVMLKLGTYGFLRFGLYLFPEASQHFAPVLMTLGVVGIIYGSVVAAMQRDLKRLVAYSSVAHLGFVVIGIFSFNVQGVVGSVLQMVNHGISTGALFVLVGIIYKRCHTREISELGGLQKPAPLLAAVFLMVTLSSIGVPGLNGFVGEFLILLGTFVAHRWWAVVAAAGVILAALYLLWAYQRVFHGPVTAANTNIRDVNWREGFLLAPFVAAILFMGIYPKPVIDRIEPAVEALLEYMDTVTQEQASNFERSEPDATRSEPSETEERPTVDTGDGLSAHASGAVLAAAATHSAAYTGGDAENVSANVGATSLSEEASS